MTRWWQRSSTGSHKYRKTPQFIRYATACRGLGFAPLFVNTINWPVLRRRRRCIGFLPRIRNDIPGRSLSLRLDCKFYGSLAISSWIQISHSRWVVGLDWRLVGIELIHDPFLADDVSVATTDEFIKQLYGGIFGTGSDGLPPKFTGSWFVSCVFMPPILL